MKLNKTMGRVATTLVATAMLASVAAPAYAAGVITSTGNTAANDINSITVTKTVKTDGNTYAPNTTFTFDVSKGEEKTFNDGTGNVTAEPGVVGGLTAGTGAVFAPVADDAGKVVAPSATYTATDTLNVDDSVFPAAGIYHYVVKENNTSYEGVTKDGSTYDVYLYVYNTADYSDLYVGNVVTVKNGTTDSKADLSFTNHYGDEDGDDTTHDVTVKKVVAGKQGDMVNDEFNFAVDVDVAQGAPAEYYKVVVDYDSTDTGNAKDQTIAIQSGADPVNVTVKHNGTITIYGLSASDTYTIAETTGADEAGYVVTDDKKDDAEGTVSGHATQDGELYTVTNTKEGTAPTGIVMDVAPYALLVVVAAAGCFVFMRKRRED